MWPVAPRVGTCEILPWGREGKEILCLRKAAQRAELLPLAARWVLGNGAELMGTSRVTVNCTDCVIWGD